MTIDDVFEKIMLYLNDVTDDIDLDDDPEHRAYRRRLAGQCPKCNVRLEPIYHLDHLLQCPKCGLWYSKNPFL